MSDDFDTAPVPFMHAGRCRLFVEADAERMGFCPDPGGHYYEALWQLDDGTLVLLVSEEVPPEYGGGWDRSAKALTPDEALYWWLANGGGEGPWGDHLRTLVGRERPRRMRASPDFSQVIWGDREFLFPGDHQRAAVRCLWEAWTTEAPVLTEATVQEEAGLNCRLAQLFQGHPAWGTLIVKAGEKGAKGLFRLADPA
jgi:hypothetical protein